MAKATVLNFDSEAISTPETQDTLSQERGVLIQVNWEIKTASQLDDDDAEFRDIALRSRNKWMDENPA